MLLLLTGSTPHWQEQEKLLLRDNTKLKRRNDVLDRLVSLRHEHLCMLLSSSCLKDYEDEKLLQKIDPFKVFKLYEMAAERAQQLLCAFASASSSVEKLRSWEEIVRGVQVRDFVWVHVCVCVCVRVCVCR